MKPVIKEILNGNFKLVWASFYIQCELNVFQIIKPGLYFCPFDSIDNFDICRTISYLIILLNMDNAILSSLYNIFKNIYSLNKKTKKLL